MITLFLVSGSGAGARYIIRKVEKCEAAWYVDLWTVQVQPYLSLLVGTVRKTYFIVCVDELCVLYCSGLILKGSTDDQNLTWNISLTASVIVEVAIFLFYPDMSQ